MSNIDTQLARQTANDIRKTVQGITPSVQILLTSDDDNEKAHATEIFNIRMSRISQQLAYLDSLLVEAPVEEVQTEPVEETGIQPNPQFEQQ